MADYIDPLAGELTDEEIEQLKKDNSALGFTEEGEKREPKGFQMPSSEGSSSPEEAPAKEGEGDGLAQYQKAVTEGAEAIGEGITVAAQMATSSGAGTVDFAIDAFNHFSPLDVPEIPKYKNEFAQGFREISSVLIPTIYATRYGTKGLSAAARARPLTIPIKGFGPWKVTSDPFVKWLGETAFSGGVGAGVDFLNQTSREGDNLLGWFKKNMPDRFANLISDDWATMDEDSEDLKRDKTVKEGVVLGIFSDLGIGFARIMNALGGLNFFNDIKPRNSNAETFFKNLETREERVGAIREMLGKSQSGDDIMDVLDDIEAEVEWGALSREEALTEVGRWQLSQKAGARLDEPILGVHNELIDPVNQGTLTPNKRGVVDAMTAAARIDANRGTRWGRLGTIMTEGAIKYGLQAKDMQRRTLVNLVKETIVNSGEWDHLSKVGTTTFEEIDAAGTRLAEVLYDPLADRGYLKGILDEFKNVNEGLENLNNPAYNGVMKAIKSYMDDYVNMDTMKAQAYLTTSMAGEISDLATGARLMDEANVIERAQEQILDRLEYLTVEKGLASYIRGSSLNYLNTWNRMWQKAKRTSPEKLQEMAEAARDNTDDALSNLIPRQRKFVNELREIGKTNPDFLKPLMLGWEMSDGRIDSIYKLSKWAENSLGIFKKAAYDLGDSRIPSQVLQGMWGTFFNSMLSSLITPQKAGLSNAIILLETPVAALAGAAIRRDMDAVKRGWYQYSALGETMQLGAAHMGMVFKKSSVDPNSVPYIMRDDLQIRNANTFEVLNATADAAEAQGNIGPRIMVNFAENLNDMQKHPVLRWGLNAMGALDGFTKAVLANAEARGRAWDEGLFYGDMRPEKLKEASKRHYDRMFDKDGFLTDEAVEWSSREVAMNLDSDAITGLNDLVKKVPAIRPFLLFPKTSMNIIGAGWNRTPLGMLAGDYRELVGHHGKKLADFSDEEVSAALKKRGIPDDYRARAKFQELQDLTTGRIAIGTTLASMAVFMGLQGRLHGDGLYDKETQKFRDEANWAKRAFQGLDGNWHSFENLGPWADWVAAVGNVVDNFNMTSEAHTENQLRKLAYIAGATLTGRLPLDGLEPLFAMLSGNEAQWARWASSFTSSMAPLSGARNDLGRLLSPMLQIHDQEYMALLRNRNRGLDVLDPDGANPTQFSWWDGEPVGSHNNMFVRLFNDFSPFKVTGKMDEGLKWLIDIGYDTRPIFVKGDDGIEFTNDEQSELYALVGKNGYFRQKVLEIMKRKDAKEFGRTMRTLRRQGYTSEQYPIEKFGYLFIELDTHMRAARDAAIGDLSNYDEILIRQHEAMKQRQRAEEGILPDDVQAILDN